MANVFKRITNTATTIDTSFYITPPGTTSIIIGFTASNKNASQGDITVRINSIFLVKDVPIPSGSTLSLLDGKMVLEEGDTLYVSSSSNDSVDLILSAMERS